MAAGRFRWAHRRRLLKKFHPGRSFRLKIGTKRFWGMLSNNLELVFADGNFHRKCTGSGANFAPGGPFHLKQRPFYSSRWDLSIDNHNMGWSTGSIPEVGRNMLQKPESTHSTPQSFKMYRKFTSTMLYSHRKWAGSHKKSLSFTLSSTFSCGGMAWWLLTFKMGETSGKWFISWIT